MSVEVRAAASRFTFQDKLYARELYFKGELTWEEIAEEVGRRSDRVAREDALKRGLPPPPPSPRPSVSVLGFWSRRGAWSGLRQRMINDLAREQIDRLRQELAEEIVEIHEGHQVIKQFVGKFFHKPLLDDLGNPVIADDGTPMTTIKAPEDFPNGEGPTLVRLMLAVLAARERHVRVVGDLVGSYENKIDPAAVRLRGTRAPDDDSTPEGGLN